MFAATGQISLLSLMVNSDMPQLVEINILDLKFHLKKFTGL